MIGAEILGALFGSFMMSRTGLWLSKGWQGGYLRVLTVHGPLIVWLFVAVALRQAQGHSTPLHAVILYVGAQALWLFIDLFAHRGRLESLRGVT